MNKTKMSNRGRQDVGGEEREKGNNNPLYTAFLDEVADMYNAEQQLIKVLPRLAKAAQSDELRQAFESHLQETEQQARRIEEAFEAMGETNHRKKCKGMEGLLAEGKEMIDEYQDGPGIDAVLIAQAQKVEHYEIASYGTICAWAEQLDQTEALELLRENLAEEKAADEKLTEIAENVANNQAEGQD